MIDIEVKLRFDCLQLITVTMGLINNFILDSCTIEIYRTLTVLLTSS